MYVSACIGVKSMTIYNLQSQGPITFYRASIFAHQYYIRIQTLSVREQEGEKTAEEREYGFGPVCVCVCVCVRVRVCRWGWRRASAEVVENIASSIHKCANAYPTSHVCMCACVCLRMCVCVSVCVCLSVHVCLCVCVCLPAE